MLRPVAEGVIEILAVSSSPLEGERVEQTYSETIWLPSELKSSPKTPVASAVDALLL